MATTIHKMSCPYDCPSTCGLEAEIEDGRLIKVKNDKTHPVSKNGICRKMQHYEQDIYSADRLRTPLRRVGRKGEAKFEPISWDEAVREITDQFKAIIEKWGAEAILPCVYSGVKAAYPLDSSQECTIIHNEKELLLNKLKLVNRGGKGTKVRI